MGYHRADVVDRAIGLLDDAGLGGLSMRRLAGDLGVRPSALYHHFANKQALLGAVADEILARGRRPTEVVTWQTELRLVCVELRDIMLAHRDGAALVLTVHALGVGAAEPMRRMAGALSWAVPTTSLPGSAPARSSTTSSDTWATSRPNGRPPTPAPRELRISRSVSRCVEGWLRLTAAAT